MIWAKAACLFLPLLTYSCSTPGSFQCNISTNGQLLSTKDLAVDMSISYPTTTRTPCNLDLRVLAGNVGVVSGGNPLVITKADTNVFPKHGTVARQGNFIGYTPRDGYEGPDTFTVVVNGSAGKAEAAGASTLTVSVDVKR